MILRFRDMTICSCRTYHCLWIPIVPSLDVVVKGHVKSDVASFRPVPPAGLEPPCFNSCFPGNDIRKFVSCFSFALHSFLSPTQESLAITDIRTISQDDSLLQPRVRVAGVRDGPLYDPHRPDALQDEAWPLYLHIGKSVGGANAVWVKGRRQREPHASHHAANAFKITFIFILILFIDSVNRVYRVQVELAQAGKTNGMGGG